MVLHLQNIKRNKSQRHNRECHICGHIVIIFSSSLTRKVCALCGKTTCDNCVSQLNPDSVYQDKKENDPKKTAFIEKVYNLFDSRTNGMKTRILICKYCFETREVNFILFLNCS